MTISKLLENARIGAKNMFGKKIGLGQKTIDSLENHRKTGGQLKVEKGWEWAGQSIFLEEENRKKGKVGSSCM